DVEVPAAVAVAPDPVAAGGEIGAERDAPAGRDGVLDADVVLLGGLGAAVHLLGDGADRGGDAERDLDRLGGVGGELDLAGVAPRVRGELGQAGVLVADAAAVRAYGVPRQGEQAGAGGVERDAQQVVLGDVPRPRALADLDPVEVGVVAGAQPVDQRIDARRRQAGRDQGVALHAQA